MVPTSASLWWKCQQVFALMRGRGGGGCVIIMKSFVDKDNNYEIVRHYVIASMKFRLRNDDSAIIHLTFFYQEEGRAIPGSYLITSALPLAAAE
jgi:hypothetical protein